MHITHQYIPLTTESQNQSSPYQVTETKTKDFHRSVDFQLTFHLLDIKKRAFWSYCDLVFCQRSSRCVTLRLRDFETSRLRNAEGENLYPYTQHKHTQMESNILEF